MGEKVLFKNIGKTKLNQDAYVDILTPTEVRNNVTVYTYKEYYRHLQLAKHNFIQEGIRFQHETVYCGQI